MNELELYEKRKKFVKVEVINYVDKKTTRIVYINIAKIKTVEPCNLDGLDCSWVKLDDEKGEFLIKGEAEDFLYACGYSTFDFEC